MLETKLPEQQLYNLVIGYISKQTNTTLRQKRNNLELLLYLYLIIDTIHTKCERLKVYFVYFK